MVDTEVSRFAIAFSIVNFINFGAVAVAVDVAYSHRLARALVRQNSQRFHQLLMQAGLLKLAGLALGAGLVFTIGPRWLGLFGPGYADALLFIPFLSPARTVLAGPAAVFLTAQGRGRFDCLANFGGSCDQSCGDLSGRDFRRGYRGRLGGAVLGTMVAQGLLVIFCQRRREILTLAWSVLRPLGPIRHRLLTQPSRSEL